MPTATQLTTFLFDLDGTLIDTVELIRRSFDHTLEVHGHDALDEAAWREGLGRPLSWQFARFTEAPAEVEEMIVTYRAHNREVHDDLIGEYPGALEAVRALAEAGGRLGIVTSKAREVAFRGLERCGFGGLFEVLVASDDIDVHKPAPDPVLRALEMLGAEAGSAVYVGDSYHDLQAGRAAGTYTAAACWGPFLREELEPERPDVWLEAPGEIAGLLGFATAG